MSEPIFNRSGKVVGWLDGEILRDLGGRHVAFIDDGNVFTYSREHTGRLSARLFRDKSGGVVAFLEGAEGGPILPVTAIPPVTPIFPIAPFSPSAPLPSLAPIDKLGWSDLEWNQYLGIDQ